MEALSPTSASLLRLESDAALMHVGWLALVDPSERGPLDLGALRAGIEARLRRAPRFRERVVRVDERSGELAWSEDPAFSLERHVARWRGADAGERELHVVAERFLSGTLDREHPLWSVLLVPRARGGAALLGKVHRALLDGQAPDALERIVFDGSGAEAPTRTLSPRAAQAAAARLSGAGAAGARVREAELIDEYRSMRRRETIAGQRGDGRIADTLRRTALLGRRTEGALASARPSYLNGPAGGRRAIVTARVDLARVGRIARQTGVEPHDVVLALVAGALRRLALAGGVAPEDLRALVPLDPAEEALPGEGACAVLGLPVSERDPAARLDLVHVALSAARRPRREPGEPVPTVLAGPREELAARLAMGSRVANLTVASVRGPERALFAGGARVRALFPLLPTPEDHALALATTTYDRRLHVAATADASALDAIDRLPVMLAEAADELALATGAGGPASAMATIDARWNESASQDSGSWAHGWPRQSGAPDST